jgi:hypothetical protein
METFEPKTAVSTTSGASLSLAESFGELDAQVGLLRQSSGWRTAGYSALEVERPDGSTRRLEVADMLELSARFDELAKRAEAA